MFFTDMAGLQEQNAKYSKWDLSVSKQICYRIPVLAECILMEETGKKNTLKQTGILLNLSFQDIDFKIC